MKKVALVFILAVIVPSLALAWLAVRSLRDQQLVLERQQSLLCQTVTDAFAKQVNDYLTDVQREFNMLVETLVTNAEPRTAAADFDERLRTNWPAADVGFAVTVSGNLLSPCPPTTIEGQLFCRDNGGFLANRESAEVYWNDVSRNQGFGNNTAQIQQPAQLANTAQQAESVANINTYQNYQLNAGNNLKVQSRKVNPSQQIVPPNDNGQGNFSKVVSAEAEFRQLIGDAKDGMLARFLQNKLKLMFWHRLDRDPQLVYGAQLNLDRITAMLRVMLGGPANLDLRPVRNANYVGNFSGTTSTEPGKFSAPEDICLVVLDDNARPVAISDEMLSQLISGGTSLRSRSGIESQFRERFKTDLKHPFVATEIGEALPHWEVAAYLRNPEQFKQSARTIQLTLGMFISVLVLAIGVGSWLIVRDLNRQLTLARQKTDFVSNVSHELKTPLTSIRMFSELLAEGRVAGHEKQRSYLNIITSEAARLTRLINNVLDFSRSERGEKKYNFSEFDLAALTNETVGTYRPHLESSGFRLNASIPPTPIGVRGDRDALAQIIVNLLSNAEKYSNGTKEITVEIPPTEPASNSAVVKVLDRGPGVPRGLEEKIFEQFYRVPDALSTGIQGSGLGLTLARQIARAHGGDVVYSPRDGGGSCFSLQLPLSPVTNENQNSNC
jgi:signal transduction histidine kinase